MRRLAVAAATFTALVASAPAFGQSIQVDPPSAPAGTEITVEAFDFLPGEIVTLQFGGQTLAEGQADDEGFVRLVGTIPDLAPGEHPLLVGSETAQVDLMYEVLEPTETPTETEPTVEGEGPGVVETDTTPSGTAATSSDDDGGFPWWPVVLAAILLLGGAGFLVGRKSDKKKPPRKPPPPERKPTPPRGAGPPPPAQGSGSEAPTQVVPAAGPAATAPGTGAAVPYRFMCQERDRRKIPFGSEYTVERLEVARPMPGGPCVWTATHYRRSGYHFDVFQCTLDLGHSGPHEFTGPREWREPSAENTYHEEVERWTEVVRVDYECDMTKEEVWARWMLLCNVCGEKRGDAPVCPHCGVGDPQAEPPERETVLRKWREQTGAHLIGACPVCGEPRDASPCPHCGME